MDDTPARLFFLQPANATQRLYEALRAVFVDGCHQKDVAQAAGYSFDAFRQQVHQFREDCATGQPPPFSARVRGGDRRAARGRLGNRNAPPSRTAAP
jgi:hypothetical protein